MHYGTLLPLNGDKIIELPQLKTYDVLLLTAIANPKPLYDFLKINCKTVTHLAYRDHHQFGVGDALKTREIFDNIASNEKIIITTEKDAMRLEANELRQHINALPFFIQTVRFDFPQNDKQLFNQLLLNYVRKNSGNSKLH